MTEFEMSWMERRVILFFPKSSDGGGGFFPIYLYWAQQYNRSQNPAPAGVAKTR